RHRRNGRVPRGDGRRLLGPDAPRVRRLARLLHAAAVGAPLSRAAARLPADDLAPAAGPAVAPRAPDGRRRAGFGGGDVRRRHREDPEGAEEENGGGRCVSDARTAGGAGLHDRGSLERGGWSPLNTSRTTR